MYSGTGAAVQTVVVDGKVLMRDRRVDGEDEVRTGHAQPHGGSAAKTDRADLRGRITMTDHDIAGVTVPDYGPRLRRRADRITALVRAATDEQLDAVAPATPEWRVRDVLAHLAGVPTDILAGRMDGVASDPWTAAQVDRVPRRAARPRCSPSGTRAVRRRRADDPRLRRGGRAVAVLDAVTHEHDIRDALDAPGARDSDAVHIGSDWWRTAWAKSQPRRRPGALRVETELWTHTFGDGAPAATLGAARSSSCAPPPAGAATAQITALELGRRRRAARLVVMPIFTPRAEDFDG